MMHRLFSVADLKLMIDAIKSSRFLTEAKTQELVEGLRTLCSKHQAQALRREVIVTNRVKNMNESIHRSVEFLTIHGRWSGEEVACSGLSNQVCLLTEDA